MERTETMIGAPNVRLELANLPENVSLIREMLAGVAEAVPFEDGQLDDIKTVVSEAANNVVIHAYDGQEGALEVEVRIDDGRIEVVVRDHGTGMKPKPASQEEFRGIGLAVIKALTDRAEFGGAIGVGTEVRMQFSTPGARRPPGSSDDISRAGETSAGEAVTSGATAALEIAPVSLARSVLSRPLSALAARARFSIDRLSDIQLVTDALTAQAERTVPHGTLQLAVAVDVRSLELRFGPFAAGKATQLVGGSGVSGLEALLETLSDEVLVAAYGDAEVLTLRLLDTR